jgi:hypothetical protein
MVQLDCVVCHAILAEFGGIGCIFVHANEQIRQNARCLREGAVAILRCCHDAAAITLQASLGVFELRLAPDRRR